MEKTEKLIKEVKELLAGEKNPIISTKKILYDKKTNQFSIKIPREQALAGKLKENREIKIVINPSSKELEESQRSHFIIYGKEKKQEEEKSSSQN